MIKKKNYRKIKNLYLERSLNPKVIKRNTIIDYKGVYWDKSKTIPNSNKANEYKTAEWISNRFKVDVYLMPEIRENGHKVYDYLLDNSLERWECKANISGTNINTIKNNIDIRQATSYVFDINNCKDIDGNKISYDLLENMINRAYEIKEYLNLLIVKDGNDLIGIYKRK